MPVLMELSRIIISETADQQIIVLREVEGQQRSFPIVIGIFEARAIDLRVKDITMPRPLTHDLLANVIVQMGGELDSVLVTELREHTFYALLRIRRDGELIEVDSRPSDAIALAVSVGAPVYVAEEVLDEVCQG